MGHAVRAAGSRECAMKMLPVRKLVEISRPAMEAFSCVEPKQWDQRAILVELIGEIGSLAHHVQYWDGFKRGRVEYSKLADECSDVLFILLRLARENSIELPSEIAVGEPSNERSADLLLQLSSHVPRLRGPAEELPGAICDMLRAVGLLAGQFGLNLIEVHRCEMNIALQFFDACGVKWPHPRPFRHPIAAWRLRRMLLEKRKWRPN